jgi:hypothetical protein
MMVETSIDGITATLQAARRNLLMRRAAHVLLWTLAVLLAGLLLPPALVEASRLPADWRYVALLSAGVVLVTGSALAFGKIPDLRDLARRADETYGLGERLSAVMAARPPSEGPGAAIFANLAADAVRHADRVKPGRLEPLVTRGGILATGVLLLVLGSAALMLEPARTSQPAVQASAAVTDQESLRQNLQAVADVLREDAEKRQDSYLAAVAEAMKELARQAEAQTDSRELQKSVEGLLDHARMAYGKNLPIWLRTDASPADRYDLAKDRNLEQLAGRATGSRPVELPEGGSGEELIPETFGERDAARNASVVPMRPGEIRTSGDQDELKLQGQNIVREGSNTSATGEAKSGGMGGSPPSMGEREGPDPADLNGATAALAGGAAQSSAGSSRVAGQGTQDLNDPSQPATREIAQGPEQVLLPPDQYRQGRRIRMQMNPSGDVAAGADDAAPGFANARRGEPSPVSRDTPSLRDQDMFSRVFVHDEGGPK